MSGIPCTLLRGEIFWKAGDLPPMDSCAFEAWRDGTLACRDSCTETQTANPFTEIKQDCKINEEPIEVTSY